MTSPEPEPEPIEMQTQGLGHGYDRLAEWMSLHPELAIFRRFGSRFTELILYYQAEITQLEHRLQELRAGDKRSADVDRQLQGLAWTKLARSRTSSTGQEAPEHEQYRIAMRLREIMPQYYQALCLQKKTLSLRRPHPKVLKDLRDWMTRPSLGNITILSPDCRTWDKCPEMEKDLLTFEDSMMDGFTSFLTYTIIDIYHSLLGRHIHKKRAKGNNTLPLNSSDLDVITYSHRYIAFFTRTFTVLIACMLPIAAIMLLNSVDEMSKRLNIIACLTGLFSVCMNIFTTATLPEIFAATAAFAAVLVVFLSANGGSPSNG
ncbi:hypothetical protein CONLIGDRAFT_718817 [Coniochaeta ligniaria NRRL 30616]|uniref:DUF6594 domain-containing protein n=1 Tax=Coniochaeta ligniaria NRRL 30616 TaxID=1408157 RepID=A0A1J7J3V7_9PEZI|nr:hypothetical protein CONLIGDRAFT_718817 [Coniochaeta ligniaria NRRL 30616]